MFKVNDYIVYRKNVCKVIEIKNVRGDDYYVLVPVTDNSLTINVKVNMIDNVRKIISKEEVENIINNIPNIPIIECENDKFIEYEYKKLLNEQSHEGLISIIKTTYLRNKKREDNKRKIGEKDNTYFKKAESILYTEFSLALNKSFDETKEYVIKRVEESLNK